MSGERLLGPGHAGKGKVCHHLRDFRLSCSEYEALRLRADGHCEICDRPEGAGDTDKLVIDHCHRTHEVRGLVCYRCNSVLAHFDGNRAGGMDPLWERRAEKYIAAVRLWAEYGKACKQLGTSRIEDMRAHVRAVVIQQGGQVEFDLPTPERPVFQPPKRPGAYPRGDCPLCGVEVSFRKDGKPTWHWSRLHPMGTVTCTASA